MRWSRTLAMSGCGSAVTTRDDDAHRRNEMQALLEGMDVACEAEDGGLYYDLNLRFHALVLELSNNQRAHQAYDDYVKELHLVRRKYFNVPGNMRRSNKEHRAIFEAIVAGNHSRARAAAEKHVQAGRVRMLDSFDVTAPAGRSG
jgi:DNA-binding GntR family transcriptional regulator